MSTKAIDTLRQGLYDAKLALETLGVQNGAVQKIIRVLDETVTRRDSRIAFSASIFCVHERHVLLINHKLLGLYLPLGGELEIWETPLEAAIRETREEAGYEAHEILFPAIPGAPDGAPCGLLPFGFEQHTAGPKGMHMNFCFVAVVPHRNVVGDGSWSDCKWFHIDEYDPNEVYSSLNVAECIKQIRNLPNHVLR